MLRALVPLALLILAPLAGAHSVPADLAVVPFSEPLSREGETSTLITFDYRCGGMSTQPSEAGMSVWFVVTSAPAWARFRIEPAGVELAPCEGVGHAAATLVGTAVDNGTEAGPVEILARWNTSGMALDLVVRTEVVPPWSPVVVIDVPETQKIAKPQQAVVFPATFTNVGSGMTKLSFEVVAKSESLQVPVPNPVVLQGRGAPGATAQVPITVQTPYKNGPNDDQGFVTFRVVPSKPLDPAERGEPQEITVRVHTKGMYVPAAQFFGVMAALGAAAVLVRRRDAR